MTLTKIHAIVNSGATAPYRALKSISDELNSVSKNVKFYWMPNGGREFHGFYCSTASLTPVMDKSIVGRPLCEAMIFVESNVMSFDNGATTFASDTIEQEFSKMIDQDMEEQFRMYFHI